MATKTESDLEQRLKLAVEKTMSASDDVKGLVCCNENGYLYSASGTMNEESAAILSHLSALVGQLENVNESPVIQLEGKDGSRVLVRKTADVIVGIHKKIPQTTKT